MSKSKEEAIEKHFGFQGKTDDKAWFQASVKHYLETGKPSGSFYQAIVSAMSEYAKQESIAFAEWQVNNGWEWSTSHRFKTGEVRWFVVEDFKAPSEYITTEQLYNIFTQSKNEIK